MKPIYWILILIAVGALIFFLIRRKRKNGSTSGNKALGIMRDLSGLGSPELIRQVENECELTFNTSLEVNKCAYQKLTGTA